ncbi:30S ribosome-binding factor RbfA [Bacteroidales bacterium OttesenSCG-928-K03]|nr:30S ribosome-binding factor RbfA [Odoribacter sp. OttesenSCG-928-L07]MDL2239400.1 30S ribosome-binding factor RbfA [Bacteroidales bacterium OttesenSCG-928-L14]MDL2240740.1 30S ribosome-binding factor RbfA [Bacteroidales bacterium OttesenSCG-928-K22]MDL2242735.1 30S ribosome-binding factor RbfA [Bacteroidales bacterium OttesenSCG-928-K03]
METIRQQRVQSLILQELGEFLRKQTPEWFPGMMITVTKVNITKDLSVAKVYISIFGSQDQNIILKIIKDHSKEIRYQLGLKIGKQLRIVPELSYFIDDSLDYLENIDRLLK